MWKSSLLNLSLILVTTLCVWSIVAHLHILKGESINGQEIFPPGKVKQNFKSDRDFSLNSSVEIPLSKNTNAKKEITITKSTLRKDTKAALVKSNDNVSDSHITSKTYGSHISGSTLNHHLVLGLAADTDAKSFVMFCASIRDVSSDIDVIIFVNAPIPTRHIDIAERFNIVLYEYDHTLLEPAFIRSYHPSSIRWILFDRLLHDSNDQKLKQYSEILFADVRDTIFQSDPFLLVPERSNQFITILENNGVNIASCGWNSGWIQDCFGQEMLDKVGDKNIICSGIGIATTDVAQQYLHTMSSILLGEDKELGQRFPKCERNGVDQGVHNVLVHTNRIPHLFVRSEDNFLITHIQSSQLAQTAETVIGVDGKPYAIVHQYDRWHALQVRLAVKYVYWTNCEDEEESWNDEEACVNYKYVSGTDIFAGQCDIGSFRALTSSSCCAACDRKKRVENGVVRQCDAFAYTDGICFFKSCSYDEMKQSLAAKSEMIEANTKILPNPRLMSAFKIPSSS